MSAAPSVSRGSAAVSKIYLRYFREAVAGGSRVSLFMVPPTAATKYG